LHENSYIFKLNGLYVGQFDAVGLAVRVHAKDILLSGVPDDLYDFHQLVHGTFSGENGLIHNHLGDDTS